MIVGLHTSARLTKRFNARLEGVCDQPSMATPKVQTRGRTPRRRRSPFEWLGRGIARNPWYAIILWTSIGIACLIPAANVGAVISGTFSNPLPNSDESVQAQNAYSAAFPHAQSSPSSAIILLESPNILSPASKNATMGITNKIQSDKTLQNVSSVLSVYSAYEGYLIGQAEFGWSFLGPALAATPSLPASVNESASLVWSPATAYLKAWTAEVQNNLTSGTPPSAADWPAYQETRADYPANSSLAEILATFYNGDGGSTVGFNATVAEGCLNTQNVTDCADNAMESSVPFILPALFPSSAELTPVALALGSLSLENWTRAVAQQVVGAQLLGSEVGLSPSWLLTLWRASPAGPPSALEIESWAAAQVAEDPFKDLPLPVPAELYTSFVNPAQSATLIIVSFSAPDTYLVNGTSVTYGDVSQIQTDVTQALASSPSFSTVKAYETGAAPLDSATNYLATSALSLLLVLTIVVLLVIMLIYFRAPAAPLLAFGMIGIALLVSFAVIFAVGTYVTSFNSEIESIILVFLMAIGTDYSVFLLARYREELVKGTPPKQAVATTVRWAGQSITTSGMAVMVVALALTLSGISFLNELGIALLISVFFALVVNLTVLPSILLLAGPKVFWPNSGKRFQRYAESRRESIRTHRDFISRAGRTATQRPLAVVGLILLLSIPVVVVAINVPVSYDITNIGLPASNPAQVGFVQLGDSFGDSYSSPSFVLVNFTAPLVSSSGPNTQEFTEAAGLSYVMNSTPGVSGVSTLVGSGGAPLDTWLGFHSLPTAVKIELNESLATYVGVNGESLLFNVVTNSSGYSASAITVVDNLQQRVQAYESTHAGIAKFYIGGAAPTTQDIQSLVSSAEEEMLIGAALGLFILMLIILGSAFVPILALGVIGLSILWSWAATYFVVGILENEALIFLLPLILIILVLGLGMDYNVLLLTRVKEERSRGERGALAIKDAVTHAGGVITAAAVILGGAFLLLGFTSPLGLLAAIGLGIGFAVILQAFVVQLFFTPAVLTLGKEWIWSGLRRSR